MMDEDRELKEYCRKLSEALVDYIARYGMTEKARAAFGLDRRDAKPPEHCAPRDSHHASR